MEGQELIEDIHNRITHSDPEIVLDSLIGSLETIEKVFPKYYGSFIAEFTQNADDAGSSHFTIELDNTGVTLKNDGHPFTEEDVKSICKLGRTSKELDESIGYLGIGFKSVFLISHAPQIHSGQYHFKFDEKCGQIGDKKIPWQMIPIWIQSKNELGSEKCTRFYLPLKNREIFEKISEEFSEDNLNSRVLLFLKNLEQIEIINKEKQENRKIVKSLKNSVTVKTDGYAIYQLDDISSKIKNTEYWLLISQNFQIPEDVKNDPITRQWNRDALKKRRIQIAFKLNDSYELDTISKGTIHLGVYSFLPLKDIESGLNFLIHADLLTNPGRSDIIKDSKWNEWSLQQVVTSLEDKCIPIFKSHKKWKWNFTTVLTISTSNVHNLLRKFISDPLKDSLRNCPCLISNEGNFVTASESVFFDDDFRTVFSIKELSEIVPERKILDLKCDFPDDFRWKFDLKEFKFKSNYYAKEVLSYLESRKDDIPLLETYYNKLNDLKIRPTKIPVILCEDFSFKEPREAYIESNEESPSVPIVNQKFGEKTFEIFRSFGVNEKFYRDDTIERIRSIEKSWDTKSEQDRFNDLIYLKEKWETRNYNKDFFSFFTIKTKSGQWIKPKKAYLTKEFKTTYDLEEALGRVNFDRPIAFIDPDLINLDKSGPHSWKRFLDEFGAIDGEKNPVPTEVVGRIGELFAMMYEKQGGRNPKDVHEEDLGYDILSRIGNEECFIESKAVKSEGSSITLTKTEHNCLILNPERYFIYITLSPLTDNPRLFIIHAMDLDIENDISIKIPHKNWFKFAKEIT